MPKLPSNLQNVFTLLLGVGGAQFISIGAILAYTRIYSEAQLGLLAIFTSIVIIFRLVANGGYEPAIVLPKSDTEARSVLYLCFSFNILAASLSLLLVFFSDYLIHLFYPDLTQDLQGIIWLFPFSLLFEAGILALKYWLNRFKRYKIISSARFAQAVVSACVSIIMGWQGALVHGLIWGLVLGQASNWALMLLGSQIEDKWSFDFANIMAVAKKYRQFLQYGVLGGWLNTLASEAPFLILPRFFGEAVTGIFSVARRILFAPINLVGSSISTVYFEQASKAHQMGGQHLAQLTKSTLKYMLLVSVLPALFVFIFGESLFAILFGESYRMAGLYASWLMPWILIKFLSHPLSYLVDIKLKLQAQFLYNIVLFIGQAGILLAMGFLAFASLPAIIAYGVVGLVLSCLYLVFLLRLGEVV